MRGKVIVMIAVGLFCVASAVNSKAQPPRKAVSSAEVNGTFHSYFKGKFKGSFNEIKILALGKGKLKIAFDLTYPHVDGTGELSANVGQAEGEGSITGDTAVYSNSEFGKCEITIKFVRPGTITVSEESEGGGCGFGHNVTADGIYKKVSGGKPNFKQ